MALEDFDGCVNDDHCLLEKFASVTVPCRHLLTMAIKHLFMKSHLRGPVHPIANFAHRIFDGEMTVDTTMLLSELFRLVQKELYDFPKSLSYRSHQRQQVFALSSLLQMMVKGRALVVFG
tara:strand:- start:1464 stop:1823 length:360 start_codon:yes stop_codon:yes gene_type:complete